jgi:DNA-binding transcriptional regulator GbsR (MarR family)
VEEAQRLLAKKHFVEETGLFFEQMGLPRMAGRVLGWLLVSDPPHQTLNQLKETLTASKGSISTMTRLLIQVGLIERVSLPGQRRDYFRIKPHVWSQLIEQRLFQVTALRRLAEQGLGLLEGERPPVKQRLEEMYDVYAFFERELPALMERWEAERRERIQAS